MNDIKIRLNNVVKEFPLQRGETSALRAVDGVSLDIYDGEFFGLLGASGCGKTTTLRMIAGFEQPTSGEILIDGTPVQGVPPFFRPVNTVFQDYALFPHMTVLRNVMFGLEMERVPRREAESRAREALEMVRLPQAANRKPRELSGGQQQRVALARALVKRPSVLLLDEPLGALDLKLRREMQIELKTMQQELKITFVFVTHDQEEALTMADRIAVMHAGKVLQVGRPDEIYETPATRYVADFIGETNFLEGTLTEINGRTGHVELSGTNTIVEGIPADDHLTVGQNVTLAIRPEKVSIYPLDGKMKNSETHHLQGQIQQVYYIGTDTRYEINVDGRIIAARVQNTGSLAELTLARGAMVEVVWDSSRARILTH